MLRGDPFAVDQAHGMVAPVVLFNLLWDTSGNA